MLNVLRAYADGIIIGARTLLSEPGITCHVYEERLTRQRREVLGKKYQLRRDCIVRRYGYSL